MTTPRCEDCRFFAPKHGEMKPADGLCRRSAPVSMGPKWPTVRSVDWCGEFRQAERPPAAARTEIDTVLLVAKPHQFYEWCEANGRDRLDLGLLAVTPDLIDRIRARSFRPSIEVVEVGDWPPDRLQEARTQLDMSRRLP